VTWLHDPVKSRRGFAAFIDEHKDQLRATTPSSNVLEAIGEADVLIVHKEQVPAEAVATAPPLRLVQHLGRDARGLPMETIRSRGIVATATPLVNYSTVAEQAWATILALLKRLPDQREYIDSGAYVNQWGAYHPQSRVVSDLTIGFVGMGEIARPMATVAAAFGMRILYWDQTRFHDLESRWNMEFVSWEEIWSVPDVVSLQLALNEQTEGIVDARTIGSMKPGALFQNSARGRLVDEDALVAALQSGTLGGAALDVFATEPLPLTNPLRELARSEPNRVILTPHSAAQGPWTWVRDSQALWLNVRRFLDGEPVHHVIS